MRTFFAMVRASFLSAASYKLGMFFSVASLLFSIVPIYYMSTALQNTMAPVIAGEAPQFFSFILIGTVVYLFVTEATNTVVGSVSSTVGNGMLEQLLASPTPLPLLLISLGGYGFIWLFIRAMMLLIAGTLLGAAILWSHALQALLLLILIVAVYGAISVIAAALIVAFRSQGPFTSGVLLVSAVIGGIWYPTSVVPGWIKPLVPFVPLSYGLKAFRKVILGGAGLGDPDVANAFYMLTLFFLAFISVGTLMMHFALRYARRNGTLSAY